MFRCMKLLKNFEYINSSMGMPQVIGVVRSFMTDVCSCSVPLASWRCSDSVGILSLFSFSTHSTVGSLCGVRTIELRRRLLTYFPFLPIITRDYFIRYVRIDT